MPDSLPSPRATPSKHNFLVLRDEPEKVTEAGIEMPNPELERTGTVVVVGPDVPEYIKRGTRLMWLCELGYSGIEIDGTEYLVMNEDEVAVFLPEVTDGS